MKTKARTWAAFAIVFSPYRAGVRNAGCEGRRARRNVVLVHGAWGGRLEAGARSIGAPFRRPGMHVTAVQNPLTSLADSAAATRRALALQDGPTRGWSLTPGAATVISETGTDPKVTALVYVARRRAPDAAEDFVALSGKFPTIAGRGRVSSNRDGFHQGLSEKAFLDSFANGVPTRTSRSPLCPSRNRPAASLFGGRTTAAALARKA